MNRRDFLRLAGVAGLTVMLPRGATAQAADIDHFFVFVHAGGGWDATFICDPKGRANEEEENPVDHYFTDDIGTAGNLRYAPIGNNEAFFQKHYQRTLVLNGIDNQTNSHDGGTRHTWSGKLSEGYPALAAIIAGVTAREQPMAFVSNGGYDLTQGLVAPTRTGNIGAINRIAYTNAIDGNRPEGELYHSEATSDRIQAALDRRRPWLERKFALPRSKAAVSQLYAARTGKNEVRRLSEFLPGEFDRDGLKRQAQVACAAFRAGISKCANLTRGGFDTHGDHDDRQSASMAGLIAGVDFLWDEAERQGIADKLTVVVGSDFGRTPAYNSGNGKDHWSTTSMMLMGRGITGNRVIGASDERVRSLAINPSTFAVDASGVRLEPKHIHRALRKLAGVEESDAARRLYPLVGADDLAILG